MPVIVYIMGLGHSGSTLLDLLLGSHTRTFSVGELTPLSSTAKTGRRERVLNGECVCGAPTKLVCPFWGEVDRRLRNEHAMSLRGIEIDPDDPDSFRAANRAIYGTVADVSGCEYIVDSSKRGLRLARLIEAGFEVRPIQILREPHGVIFSHMRKGYDVVELCRNYSRQTVRHYRLLADRPHMLIRYEMLATRPEVTVRSVMEWLGLEFEPAQMRWSLAVHHNLAGNRMRFSDDDSIELDRKWKAGLTARERWTISLRTLPARLRVRGSGVLGGTR